MTCRIFSLLLALLLVPVMLNGAETAAEKEAGAEREVVEGENKSTRRPEPFELAQWIDGELARRWSGAGLTPAEIATDAEFLRRVYLDLVGTIPAVAEARDFLADTSASKREALIDCLLVDPRSATHLSRVWRRLMIPPGSPEANLAPRLEPWLRDQFLTNVPYDQLVRDVLAAPTNYGIGSPGVFYVAVGNDPQTATAAVARIFLGTRIGCAQCHDHPFTPRTQADFWGSAAFFGDVGRRAPRPLAKGAELKIRQPETRTVYPARYLDGKTPSFPGGRTPRQLFADWVVRQPDFAVTSVNRLWQHLFGRGLATPLDELEIVEKRPAILDELGRRFRAAEFDVRWFLAALCRTQAYQRTSARTTERPDDNDKDNDNDRGASLADFTYMRLKTLTSEQVFSALEQALSLPIAAVPESPRYGAERRRLIEKLDEASGDLPEEYRAGILQALTMLNGELVVGGTTLDESHTLRAVVDAPFLSPTEKIEALYLAALTRQPRPEELQRLLSFVAKKRSAADKQKAYADIFWALFNSPEFVLNH